MTFDRPRLRRRYGNCCYCSTLLSMKIAADDTHNDNEIDNQATVLIVCLLLAPILS